MTCMIRRLVQMFRVSTSSLLSVPLYCSYILLLILLHGSTKTYAELRFTVVPVNQSMYVDQSLNLSCEATSTPTGVSGGGAGGGESRSHYLTWQTRNSTGGRWEDLPKTGTQGRVSYQGTRLVFERLLRSDVGWYRCVAHSDKETKYSPDVFLNVEAKVQIVMPPRSWTVAWGTDVTLQCEVISFPLPHRSWTKNGQLIQDKQTGMSYSQPSLKINATETAVYECNAQNEHKEGLSKVNASATVTVIDGQCVQYDRSLCRVERSGVVPSPLSVYVPVSRPVSTVITAAEDLISNLVMNMVEPTTDCHNAMLRILCAFSLPDCVTPISTGLAEPRQLCRESCMAVRDLICFNQWQPSGADDGVETRGGVRRGSILPVCEDLPERTPGGAGGAYNSSSFLSSTKTSSPSSSAISCLYIDFFSVPSNQTTTSCYTNDGRNYRGTVSRTETGKQCQPWSVQYPHVHKRYPTVYAGVLEGAGAACRNPGGEQDRPWCFTTDPATRWQHCNISECVDDINETLDVVTPVRHFSDQTASNISGLMTIETIYIIAAVGIISITVVIVVIAITVRLTLCRVRTPYSTVARHHADGLLYSATRTSPNTSPYDEDINIDIDMLPSNVSYCLQQLPPLLPTRGSGERVEDEDEGFRKMGRGGGELIERGGGDENMALLQRLEYQRNDIVWVRNLGEGMYGRVFLAEGPNIGRNSNTVEGKGGPPITGSRFGGIGAGGCARTLLGGRGVGGECEEGGDKWSFFVVKMLSEDATVDHRTRFITELTLIASLAHTNIIRIVGVCLTGSLLCALYEYMPGGDLQAWLVASRPVHYIQRHRSNGDDTELLRLLHIARQIAAALAHVSRLRIVHRDVATRNCLVSCVAPSGPDSSPMHGDCRDIIVKLSDFSLAIRLPPVVDPTNDVNFDNRRLTMTSMTTCDFVEGSDNEPIPIRWLSPEAIKFNQYSCSSDIWSYGVTLWEVFTYAKQPYSDLEDGEEVAACVLGGGILERPDAASTDLYELMRYCWAWNSLERPSIEVVHETLCTLEMKEREMCWRGGGAAPPPSILNNNQQHTTSVIT